MAGVGTAFGGADGGMPFGRGGGAPDMAKEVEHLLFIQLEVRCF